MVVIYRGVVLERGGAPLWLIFLSWNGAPVNIFITGGTLILQRSGKSAEAAALSIMTYLNVSL